MKRPKDASPAPTLRDFCRGVGGALASLKLTVALLVLMMALVVVGTVDQVRLGTWLAQEKYFSSWIVFHSTAGGARLPVFPGGLTVGALWLVNLLAAHASRFVWSRRRVGIILVHAGLFLLVLGQGLTQILAVESRMAIDEGHAKNYSEDYRESELAIVRTSDPEADEVHAIPDVLLAKETTLAPLGLPFTVAVHRYYPNAVLRSGGRSSATRGIGPGLSVEEAPVVTADDEVNDVTALVELRASTGSLGTWMLSTAFAGPQTVVHGGHEYRLSLRPRRHYYPFKLHLKNFTHDIYPGTEIPKNFSSLLHLTDPETNEDRDVLVYMNNPLRYRGLTFYQASFGKDDTLSVLQVVRNPVWLAPYLACLIVALGLAWQFGSHLADFRRKKT